MQKSNLLQGGKARNLCLPARWQLTLSGTRIIGRLILRSAAIDPIQKGFIR